MQITFDTSNDNDLKILEAFMGVALTQKAQPAVAQNTGTTVTARSSLSTEDSGVSGEAEQQAASPAPEKKTRAPKKSATPVEASAGSEASKSSDPVDVKQEKTAGQSTDKKLTLDEVRAALQLFTSTNGVPAGIELLKKYGAGRVSELAEENFAAFVKECA